MYGSVLVKLLMSSDIDGTIIRIIRGGNENKQVWFLLISKSLDNNGFLEDTEITFIDKTDPFNLGVRTLGLIR